MHTYGHVAEWLERQRSDHATWVRILLRSIFQECEFLIKLSWKINPARGTFGKCLKTIQRVEPSHVREFGRRNCTEAVSSCAGTKSQIIVTEG